METKEQREQSTPRDQDRGSGGSPDYGALVLNYGEAMYRVGELEAKVEELTRQLVKDGGPVESGSAPGPRGAHALEARVESLEEALPSDGEEDARAPGVSSGSEVRKPENRQSGELRQMRLQIAGLANQLAIAEEELRNVREHQTRRRRRKDLPKPWWKSLGGPLRRTGSQEQ